MERRFDQSNTPPELVRVQRQDALDELAQAATPTPMVYAPSTHYHASPRQPSGAGSAFVGGLFGTLGVVVALAILAIIGVAVFVYATRTPPPPPVRIVVKAPPEKYVPPERPETIFERPVLTPAIPRTVAPTTPPPPAVIEPPRKPQPAVVAPPKLGVLIFTAERVDPHRLRVIGLNEKANAVADLTIDFRVEGEREPFTRLNLSRLNVGARIDKVYDLPDVEIPEGRISATVTSGRDVP